MKKYLASLVLGVCALVGVASVQAAGAVEDAVKRGTLRVGMDPTYMPFEMTNGIGRGFLPPDGAAGPVEL
ncbi:hypothetical protein ACLBUZ_19750, partial [Pseudomonas aeruginosa]